MFQNRVMKKFASLLMILALQSTVSFANIGGTDLQNFNPAPNGNGYITVHSGDTLDYGQFNFGSFLSYSTNTLPYSTLNVGSNPQSFGDPNDRITYSHLHAAVGLMKGWDLGVSAGFTLAQDIETQNFLFNYGDTGINDVMIRTKLRLYKDQHMTLAFVGGIDFDQIKNNPFIGDNSGPSFIGEAVLDFRLSPHFKWAINLGYRLRQEGSNIPNTGVSPISDQWLYSTALAYLTDTKGSALLFEMFGSYPLEFFSIPTDRQLSNLEMALAYKWAAYDQLAIQGGFGTEVYQGLGTPDIRVFVGFNWTFGRNSEDFFAPEPTDPSPVVNDQDGDEIPDPIDQCPNTLANLDVDEKRMCKRWNPNSGAHFSRFRW